MARDERVQSAIDNWAPRFVANGVDYNDFIRVSNSIERWDDWCQKWSECGAMHAQMGERAEADRAPLLWSVKTAEETQMMCFPK
jgi:hypothetical protein